MLCVDLRAPSGAPLRLDADFTLPQGQLLALHGPSGAGKTTLLRAVAGLLAAEGTLELDGEDYRRLPAWQRPIGWVPQRQGLIPHWTPEQHLAALGPGLAVDLDAALERLGLLHLRRRPVRQLSFGERQRLALGRAVFTHRPLLLLDEPFSALDARARLDMGDLLRERLTTEHASALLATHDLHEVQRLGDRICLIADGRMVAEGPTEATMRRPPNRRAADLLGYHLLRGGFAVHPAQASWQGAPGLIEVRGLVTRALPQDFGWRVELRADDGRPFTADLRQERPLPAVGERLPVYFPDLRLDQSGEGE